MHSPPPLPPLRPYSRAEWNARALQPLIGLHAVDWLTIDAIGFPPDIAGFAHPADLPAALERGAAPDESWPRVWNSKVRNLPDNLALHVVPFVLNFVADSSRTDRGEMLGWLAKRCHSREYRRSFCRTPRADEVTLQREMRDAVADGVPLLIHLLDDDNPEVRMNAATALAACQRYRRDVAAALAARLPVEDRMHPWNAMMVALGSCDEHGEYASLYANYMANGETAVTRYFAALAWLFATVPNPPPHVLRMLGSLVTHEHVAPLNTYGFEKYVGGVCTGFDRAVDICSVAAITAAIRLASDSDATGAAMLARTALEAVFPMAHIPHHLVDDSGAEHLENTEVFATATSWLSAAQIAVVDAVLATPGVWARAIDCTFLSRLPRSEIAAREWLADCEHRRRLPMAPPIDDFIEFLAGGKLIGPARGDGNLDQTLREATTRAEHFFAEDTLTFLHLVEFEMADRALRQWVPGYSERLTPAMFRDLFHRLASDPFCDDITRHQEIFERLQSTCEYLTHPATRTLLGDFSAGDHIYDVWAYSTPASTAFALAMVGNESAIHYGDVERWETVFHARVEATVKRRLAVHDYESPFLEWVAPIIEPEPPAEDSAHRARVERWRNGETNPAASANAHANTLAGAHDWRLCSGREVPRERLRGARQCSRHRARG